MDSEKREKIDEMAVWLASVHWSRSGAGVPPMNIHTLFPAQLTQGLSLAEVHDSYLGSDPGSSSTVS